MKHNESEKCLDQLMAQRNWCEVPPVPTQFRVLFASNQQYEDWLEERRKLFFSVTP